MSMEDTGEIVDLRKRLAAAAGKANIAYDRDAGPWDWELSEESIADAIIDDLGIVPAGHGWCPVHGDALCPEQYMLFQDGRIAPGYSQFWSEDIRCGQRLPTFRLGHSGSNVDAL